MAEECGVKVNLNGSGKITINGEPITDKRLFDIFYGDMETDNDK